MKILAPSVLLVLVPLLAACTYTGYPQNHEQHQPTAQPSTPSPEDPDEAATPNTDVGNSISNKETPPTPTPTPPASGSSHAADETHREEMEEGEEPEADAVLSMVDEAVDLWQEGKIEEALAQLDKAYSQMLKIPTDSDPELLQQRDDLRQTIAKRIVEIYASEKAAAVSPGTGAIAVEINKEVLREIKSFQGPERDFFLSAYRRSGRWRPMIVEKLKKAGLPEELGWLPLIESGYKLRALSRSRALGLWQFISSTGYRFGLKRTYWVDERMDPEKSTDAAIAYLSELHQIFGDWLTALAAYNCGERTVLRAISRQKISYLDSFWDVYNYLPRETARYVPRFLAVLAIVSEPSKWGFSLPQPEPPAEFERVMVSKRLRLADLEKSVGLPKGVLAELNPELRRGATPGGDYSLRVPPGYSEKLASAALSMKEWTPPKPRYVIHVVRKGETLSSIARRYRTSVRAIARLNGLRNPNRLRIGQRLKIPTRGSRYRASPSSRRTSATSSKAKRGQPFTYTVRKGDTLWRLARRFGTTVRRIKKDNGLRSNKLRIGQRLLIRPGTR